MRRLLRYLAWALGLLLLLLITATGLILSTQIGLETLLKTSQRFLPGTLSYERLEGQLTGPLMLENLHYQATDMELSLGHLDFEWQPSELLSAKVLINRLKLDAIELHLPPPAHPPAEEPEPTPFSLSDIQLPIALEIQALTATAINIHPHQSQAPLIIDKVHLNAKTENHTLVLETLSYASPHGDGTVSGQLTPVGDYPLELKLDWVFPSPPIGPLKGHGTISGDLQQLTMTQNISGTINGTFKGQAGQILKDLHWATELQLEAAELGQFSPELADTVIRLDVNSQGTLETYQGEGKLDTTVPTLGPVNIAFKLDGTPFLLKLQHLTVSAADTPLSFTTQGSLDFAALILDLQGRWESLAWPPTGPAQIQSPQGEFTLQGGVQDYRLTLQTTLNGDALGTLNAGIQAAGTDQQIKLSSLTLRAPDKQLALDVQGEFGFSDMAFKADGQWQALAWPLNGQAQVESPQGSFSAQGTPNDYQAQLEAAIKGPDLGELKALIQAAGSERQIQLSKLSLSAPGKDLALDAQGKFGFQEQSLNLDGRWQSLSWPLSGNPQILSPSGNIKASGQLQDYTFTLDTQVQGPGIPATRLNLNGRGSLEAMDSLNLVAKLLEGEIAAQLSAGWQPQVSWQAKLQGKDLNPGLQWPDIPGKLRFATLSRGKLTEQGLETDFDLEDISGTLSGQAVQGQGRMALRGQDVYVDALSLKAGPAHLQAGGTLKQNWELDWRLDVPKLADLLPQVKGTIKGSGTLRGTRETPQAQLTLAVDDLGFSGNLIERLRAEGTVDLSGKQASRLVITGDTLNLGGQVWQKLNLEGAGTPTKHTLTTAIQGDLGRFNLALDGGLGQDQVWQGRINQLSAKATQAGDWTLEQPVKISASATQAKADTLCLGSRPSRLCVQGQWQQSSGGQGKLTLENLDFKRFDLPENLNIDTQVNAIATGSSNASGDIRGEVKLILDPGNLSIQASGNPLRVALGGATLEANTDGRQAQLTLGLDLGATGGVDGQLQVTDIPGKPRLAGKIKAAIKDLSLVSAFVPQVDNIKGRITADVDLSGALPVPTISGQVRLEDASLDIPQAGTEIRAIALNAASNGQGPLQISGAARSGQGQLQLSGQLEPDSGTINLAIVGDNFQAINTPEIQALISPDLNIHIAPDQVRVDGQVSIPQAYISPPELGESGISASQDVVIVDKSSKGNTQKAVNQAIYAKLRVILGDDVHVEAAGFKGKLAGNLLVEQSPQLAPRGSGSIEVEAGEYRIYGQDLKIQRGRVLFSGGPIDNPGLDLRVARQVDDVTAGAQIGGSLKVPKLRLFSDPAMPDSSILSYLLFGRAPDARSGSESQLLMKAASALGMSGGSVLSEKVTDTFGLDEFGVESGETAADAALVVGKYLSPELYISYGVGLFDAVNTFNMRYQISKQLLLESTTGTESSADLIYSIER